MRPKSKVPAMFMAAVSEALYPGLVERWENQAVTRETCGRQLLDSIADGRADAAIAPRSLLYYAQYRGRVEEAEIPASELLAMKACPAIPQCAVALTGHSGSTDELAQRFVAGLAKETEWLDRYGYVPVADPRARSLGRLLKAMAPKDMAGWQVILAQKLHAAGLPAETRRRYLKVLCTFGPNQHTARALWQVAEQTASEGNVACARGDLRRILAEYPPPEPVEYGLPTSPQKAKRQPLEYLPDTHWRAAAQGVLADLPERQGVANPVLDDPMVRRLHPLRITQGDPPKNGTRDLALGLHLLAAGDLDFATRDLLKVVTLHYPSRHMPTAEYLLGVCAQARGYPNVARHQWERTVRDYGGTEAAELAQAALGRLGAGEDSPVDPMPAWTECFATHGERAMTYGMRLYEHRLPLFAYKEMGKILSGIYGKHELGGRARYCAGIACAAFGNPAAAAYQWRTCLRDMAGTPWAKRSAERLAKAGQEPVPQPGQSPGKLSKGGAGMRFRLAEEFYRAGVHEEGQVILEYLKVLTVARPPLDSLEPESRRMLGQAAEHLVACLEHDGMDKGEAWQLVRSIPGIRPCLADDGEALP
jgi:hypothetical protein